LVIHTTLGQETRWTLTIGTPHILWLQTIQEDVKSNSHSPIEAIDMAQNCPPGDSCLHLALCTLSR